MHKYSGVILYKTNISVLHSKTACDFLTFMTYFVKCCIFIWLYDGMVI